MPLTNVNVEMTFTWNVSLEICSNWETGLFNSTLLYFSPAIFVTCSLNYIKANTQKWGVFAGCLLAVLMKVYKNDFTKTK